MAEIEYFGSDKWAGVRFGYVYKMGEKGLGYYLDAAQKKEKPAIVNPLVHKRKKEPAPANSKRKIWEQAKDPKAQKKSLNGGREGKSIEERLQNAGLLNEVEAVKERDREATEKAAKQAALFKAAVDNPGTVPYIPTEEFKGKKVGYVFKLGAEGLGYYLDDAEKAEEAHSQALMVIPQEEKKVNNLMYQLALRGGATQNDEGEIVYPYDQLAAFEVMEKLTKPGHKFMNLNPFHVLGLKQDHDVNELKEAYGKINALLDPEKNTDARVLPLQEVVTYAFKILANPDKRERAMETYVQAQDQVEYSWKKKNKEAVKQGQPETPYILNAAAIAEHERTQQEGEPALKPVYSPVFLEDVSKQVFKRMAELDERFKRAEATYERNLEENKLKQVANKEKKRKHEEWEDEREERVGGWRMFSKKKKKRLGSGTKLWTKPEERASHQKSKDSKELLDNEKGSGGANNTYKQSWR
jgi:DnaJ family protein C protein 8